VKTNSETGKGKEIAKKPRRIDTQTVIVLGSQTAAQSQNDNLEGAERASARTDRAPKGQVKTRGG